MQLAFGVCEWSRQDEVYPSLKERPFTFNAALDPAVASVALNLLSVLSLSHTHAHTHTHSLSRLHFLSHTHTHAHTRAKVLGFGVRVHVEWRRKSHREAKVLVGGVVVVDHPLPFRLLLDSLKRVRPALRR